MAVYSKKFADYSDYEAYEQSGNMLTPNVSYCTQENEVRMTPYEEPVVPMMVVTYNITSTTNDTILYRDTYGTFADSMEIDGQKIEGMLNSYRFDTLGDHIVKYHLTGETSIRNATLTDVNTYTDVKIPEGIETIGSTCFYVSNGNHFSSVTLPSTITIIGSYSFMSISELTSCTIYAVTPPTLEEWAFKDTPNCIFYVPAESVDAYKAAWPDFASRISPIQ